MIYFVVFLKIFTFGAVFSAVSAIDRHGPWECQANEEFVRCSVCEGNCVEPRIKDCKKECQISRCECVAKHGFVRAHDGTCIKLSECTAYRGVYYTEDGRLVSSLEGMFNPRVQKKRLNAAKDLLHGGHGSRIRAFGVAIRSKRQASYSDTSSMGSYPPPSGASLEQTGKPTSHQTNTEQQPNSKSKEKQQHYEADSIDNNNNPAPTETTSHIDEEGGGLGLSEQNTQSSQLSASSAPEFDYNPPEAAKRGGNGGERGPKPQTTPKTSQQVPFQSPARNTQLKPLSSENGGVSYTQPQDQTETVGEQSASPGAYEGAENPSPPPPEKQHADEPQTSVSETPEETTAQSEQTEVAPASREEPSNEDASAPAEPVRGVSEAHIEQWNNGVKELVEGPRFRNPHVRSQSSQELITRTKTKITKVSTVPSGANFMDFLMNTEKDLLASNRRKGGRGGGGVVGGGGPGMVLEPVISQEPIQPNLPGTFETRGHGSQIPTMHWVPAYDRSRRFRTKSQPYLYAYVNPPPVGKERIVEVRVADEQQDEDGESQPAKDEFRRTRSLL